MVPIHAQIRATRKAKGITQVDLAAAATKLFRERHPSRVDPQIDPSHLTHFERGNRGMSSDKVDCLCEVLGLQLHDGPPGTTDVDAAGCIAPSVTETVPLEDAPTVPA